VKAAAFSDDGRQIATARESIALAHPRPGWAEQELEDIWTAVCRCTTALTSSLPQAHWRAVGLAAQGDGCWLLDEALRPVGPSPVWLDGRAGAIVGEWQRDGTAESFFRLTGNVIFAGATPALLHWCQAERGSMLDASSWLLSCADAIAALLTGQVATDPVSASRGVARPAEPGWSTQVADLLGIDGRWAQLGPAVSPVVGGRGPVTPGAAEATGLTAGTPVLAATIDVLATMVGAGLRRPGDSMVVLGTSAMSIALTPELLMQPETGFNLPFVAGGWARIMATSAGTTNVDWAAALLGLPGPDPIGQLLALAAQAPAGAGGVVFLPYTAEGGERAPFVRPAARASLSGLDGGFGRADLARAVLEGVALSIRHCHQFLPTSKCPLAVAGGGARSELWCQIVADVLARDVVQLEGTEPGTRGAALLAAADPGSGRSLESVQAAWVHPGRTFSPGADAATYDTLFDVYLATVEAQTPTWELRAATTWPLERPQPALE
jgi:erythritol kinase